MPIELRTGLPGAGKTLGAVERLMEIKKLEPHRPIRVLGITDLREDLGDSLAPGEFERWYDLPAGTIVVVDEVQKYLPARRSGEPPAWISRLSEHRHLGLDFIFITQHPALIDTYVRRLVDRHVHTVRKFGTHWVERFVWPEIQPDPTSKGSLKNAERKSRHQYTKVAMAAYTSSELHTVKRSIPPFLMYGAAVVVFLPLLVWFAYKVMHYRDQDLLKRGTSAGSSRSLADSSLFSSQLAAKDHVLTAKEWSERMTPRVKGVPWSAPIFDGESVVTVPDLRCVMIERDDKTRDCRCESEQGTRVDIDQRACFEAVTDGVYNPYRPALQSVQSAPAKSASVSSSSDARGADVVSADAPVVGGAYQGRERSTAVSYVPPTYGQWSDAPLPNGVGSSK